MKTPAAVLLGYRSFGYRVVTTRSPGRDFRRARRWSFALGTAAIGLPGGRNEIAARASAREPGLSRSETGVATARLYVPSADKTVTLGESLLKRHAARGVQRRVWPLSACVSQSATPERRREALNLDMLPGRPYSDLDARCDAHDETRTAAETFAAQLARLPPPRPRRLLIA